MDCIELTGLAFDSVIGVYPSERIADQRVLLDVALELDTRPAAKGDLTKTVDYAHLRKELEFIMRAARFQLLETAAEALCRYILAPPLEARAQVQRVTVKLGKPAVSASLRVTREASEYTTSDTLFEVKGLRMFRVTGEATLGNAQVLALADATVGGARLEGGHAQTLTLPVKTYGALLVVGYT